MWMFNSINTLKYTHKTGVRNIFGALNVIFNRVSDKRIKEVGPNRACAEWLMRNGAFVRWAGSNEFVMHYDCLPLNPKDSHNYYIQEIRASEASISHHGFDHFCGCDHITTISLQKCWYLNDKGIEKLDILKGSLEDLEIVDCTEVTECGLKSLSELCNLKVLTLGNLKGVRDFDKAVEKLATDLPDCKIVLC